VSEASIIKTEFTYTASEWREAINVVLGELRGRSAVLRSLGTGGLLSLMLVVCLGSWRLLRDAHAAPPIPQPYLGLMIAALIASMVLLVSLGIWLLLFLRILIARIGSGPRVPTDAQSGRGSARDALKATVPWFLTSMIVVILPKFTQLRGEDLSAADKTSSDLSSRGTRGVIVLGAAVLIWALIYVLRVVRSRRVLYKMPPDADKPIALEASAEGLTLSNALLKLQVSWTYICRIGESTAMVVLYPKNDKPVAIPKRAFAAGELTAFHEMFARSR
jgi:hypothetical protein